MARHSSWNEEMAKKFGEALMRQTHNGVNEIAKKNKVLLLAGTRKKIDIAAAIVTHFEKLPLQDANDLFDRLNIAGSVRSGAAGEGGRSASDAAELLPAEKKRKEPEELSPGEEFGRAAMDWMPGDSTRKIYPNAVIEKNKFVKGEGVIYNVLQPLNHPENVYLRGELDRRARAMWVDGEATHKIPKELEVVATALLAVARDVEKMSVFLVGAVNADVAESMVETRYKFAEMFKQLRFALSPNKELGSALAAATLRSEELVKPAVEAAMREKDYERKQQSYSAAAPAASFAEGYSQTIQRKRPKVEDKDATCWNCGQKGHKQPGCKNPKANQEHLDKVFGANKPWFKKT